MKRTTLLASLLVALISSLLPTAARAEASASEAPTPVFSNFTDRDHYRRSSLTLILLTHRDKAYATEMAQVFRDFPMPLRYNNHNIDDVRVISVSGKQSREDIEDLLRANHVAEKVVGRWFNRTSGGYMDLGLIHDRGGYGAFYDDYRRATASLRGPEMLQDEGLELLQSSFVLVCDMDYIDKKKGAFWGQLGLALVGATFQTIGGVEYQKGFNNHDPHARQKQFRQAQMYNEIGQLITVTSEVVGDIGGFRVKMHAYLYRLDWTPGMTNYMFNNLWVDSSTPASERDNRRKEFGSYFFFSDCLKYVGDYKCSSSKTILRSLSDEGKVILDVTSRCVDKGIAKLARKFPVFRPRAPFYFDEDDAMYAHIGTKEEVTYGKKYDILEPYKDKKGTICYRRVGTVKAGSPWNNLDVRYDYHFDTSSRGTRFYVKKTNVDLNNPGLQLRES